MNASFSQTWQLLTREQYFHGRATKDMSRDLGPITDTNSGIKGMFN